MELKFNVCEVYDKVEYIDELTKKKYFIKEFLKANRNGIAEVECNINDISTFSLDKRNRLIGVGKNLYRLTLKSYKEVRKELTKKGVLYRFDASKRQ